MPATPESPQHPFPLPERPEAVPLVSVEEFARARDGPDAPIVVDVRTAAERTLAHLPADRHIPLHELPRRFAELPADRAIVVYCQFGAESRRAAAFLIRHGYPWTAALEGGIDEYARVVDPAIPRYPPHGTQSGSLLRQFPRRDSGCLAYLVGDPESRTAVIIDPGRDVDPYLAGLRDGSYRLVGVIETHTHADHLAGHSRLHEKTGAPIYLGRLSPAQYPHQRLGEGDSVEIGPEAITVLETPGHTRDHVTLRLGERVFTGDTLLLGACGRTDLGDGSAERLWESLQHKILSLPDDVEVFPAHFGARHALTERYSSTIGFERGTNEALLQPSREAFLRYMTDGWPPKPIDFDAIVRENLDS